MALIGLTFVVASPRHALATLPPPNSIQLIPSLKSGQPVGTTITWTAVASDSVPLVYRFAVRASGASSYSIVRDFSPFKTLSWTPLQDGSYNILVTIKEGFGATTTASAATTYSIVSRVTGNTPTVTAMPNPLIALYSAPPCAAGSMMQVVFTATVDLIAHSTNWQQCQPGKSVNFLVAGMRPQTTYVMQDVVSSGSSAHWDAVTKSFTTGTPTTALQFPGVSVTKGINSSTSLAEGVLFHSIVPLNSASVTAFATDLLGRLVWYYDRTHWSDLSFPYPTRILPNGGDMLLIGGEGGKNNNVLREIDLAGDPIRETNVDRVNEQLNAMGMQSILGFHHDAIVLPNGDTATLGYVMRAITQTNTVKQSDPNVIGDTVIVLDPNYQVVWAWNAFDHLPYRPPVLGENCFVNYLLYCPVPDPRAKDWLHTNAISYSPSDGNLTLSLRDQDWVIKIDYEDGRGDGHVIWRLGRGGDFTIASTAAYPWFSHQHDAHYLTPTTIGLFDNGNTRCKFVTGTCDSRGMVLTIDEQHMVVTPTVSADLGSYSDVFGSAEMLSNGDYNFTSGFQQNGTLSQAIEVQPDGTQTYVQQVQSSEYRTYRMDDLYSGTYYPLSNVRGTQSLSATQLARLQYLRPHAVR